MPTLYKAQLVESETPFLKIWRRMYVGQRPNARQILDMLGFYQERGLAVPLPKKRLSTEEKLEFTAVITALTKAVVETQQMPAGVMASTLLRIANASPEQVDGLPAIIQWVLAAFYRRCNEAPGTYALDIWGTEQTEANYIRGEPTPENIARAAQTALVGLPRPRGRPPNVANFILAKELGPIFRRSGGTTTRQRQKVVREQEGVASYIEYPEGGPYYDWLNLIVPPFNEFLHKHGLEEVTVETIVRLGSRSPFGSTTV
jgi:hypothetical protein